VRILFLTENFPPETNAAATRVYERALYWVKDGHLVTIITSAPNFPQGKLYAGWKNKWYQTEIHEGIRVVRIKTYITANRGTTRRMLDFVSFMITAFFAGLFEKRPDVIAATSPQFFAAVCGWALGSVRRIPFVFELGDLWPASIIAVGAMHPNFYLQLMEKLELFLYHRSASVAALTHAFKKNLIKRGIPANKISVVINGVDLWRYAPQSRDVNLAKAWGLENKFVFGYVGTHGMAHGLSNILNAAELLKHRDDIRFLFVGDGAERTALIAHAKKLQLNNIVFLPPQPKEMMPKVWSLCNVALVHLKNTPAFAEVIPSKMFEAMGMGLPILMALPSGEATEILEQDGAGITIPPEDPKALADAVQQLCDDKALLKKLQKLSLAAAPLHSRKSQAQQMINVLTAAAEGRGGSVGRDAP
jgi:glycosyltransferase involved in cell wall biosynthesis